MMINCNVNFEESAAQQTIVACTEENVHSELVRIFTGTFAAEFNGEADESAIYNYKSHQYILLGFGKGERAAEIKFAARKFSAVLRSKFAELATKFIFPDKWTNQEIEYFFIGFLSGCYTLNAEKKVPHFLTSANTTLQLPGSLRVPYQRALHIARGTHLAKTWLDKGNNEKTAPILGEYLSKWCTEKGLNISILNRNLALEQKLHAFLAVNKGSIHDAAFTIIEYRHPDAKIKVGLVGKCITFDTGGISIKSSSNLHYMKSDMGGGTAVIGALSAIADEKIPINLTCILPITDNAVGPESYTPSDVIRSHSGKRIEIIDTDAEGRMTLADGLSYLIKEHSPDYVLDLATLTGSAVRTFGQNCAALFCNNASLSSMLQAAGEATGERLWPLPLWDDYKKNLDSDVADLKNYSGKPLMGAIDAAMFLREFIHDHSAWAHLDIAGVAFGKTPFAKDKSATGYGVHLLVEVIERLVNVQSIATKS